MKQSWNICANEPLPHSRHGQASMSAKHGRASVIPRWAAQESAKEAPGPQTTKKLQNVVKGARGWTLANLRSKLLCAGDCLPSWWVDMVCKLANTSILLPHVVGVEIFAGLGELSKAFCELVGNFLTFEFLNDPAQNILSREGTSTE